jgi:hypothetical protein
MNPAHQLASGYCAQSVDTSIDADQMWFHLYRNALQPNDYYGDRPRITTSDEQVALINNGVMC